MQKQGKFCGRFDNGNETIPKQSKRGNISQLILWSLYNLATNNLMWTKQERKIVGESHSGAHVNWGFLGSSDGKASACNVGDPGSLGQILTEPTQKSLKKITSYPSCVYLRKHVFFKSSKEMANLSSILVVYSSWGHRESDTAEWLSTENSTLFSTWTNRSRKNIIVNRYQKNYLIENICWWKNFSTLELKESLLTWWRATKKAYRRYQI